MGWMFSLEEVLLLTLATKWRLKLKYPMMDLFLTNLQLFTLQDVNWWTGDMWIAVIFISYLNLDGTHPL